MKKQCSKLARLVHALRFIDSGQSHISQVNAILATCAIDPKSEARLIRWSLKALGPKNKQDLGVLAKYTLTLFLCDHRASFTKKQWEQFIERAVELPPDLSFSFRR